MLIVGFNKTTLLDYPGRVAATLFTGGCNFKCPFCHNGELVLKPFLQEAYSETEILDFLKQRKNILKGVCITGGEPTLQADLSEFIMKVKNLGYQVKLDTNGYMPNVLKRLLEEDLLDYVAMDIKNCRDKYAATVGIYDKQSCANVFHIDRIEESIEILQKASVPYEFRTTVVKELHTQEDLLKIGEWIRGCPHYFLQQYQDSENTIYSLMNLTSDYESCEDRKMGNEGERGKDFCFHGYSGEEMERMAEALERLSEMAGKVSVRGV